MEDTLKTMAERYVDPDKAYVGNDGARTFSQEQEDRAFIADVLALAGVERGEG